MEGAVKKQKLTLYVPEDTIERIKIQAIREKKSLSKLTEELYEKHLKSKM